MRVAKYSPFKSTSSLDHLFDNFFGTPLSDFFGGEFTSSTPSSNISEIDGGYQIDLAIPGISKDDVQIELEKDTLVISATQSSSSEETAYHRREFNYTSFKRRFYLGEDIDKEKISAKHEKGILSISLIKNTTSSSKKNIVVE